MYMDKLKLKPKNRKVFKFKIGEYVRISHMKYVFQRDYHIKWTQEVFIVTHRCKKQGLNLYRIWTNRQWQNGSSESNHRTKSN